jgi:hypothetical protein
MSMELSKPNCHRQLAAGSILWETQLGHVHRTAWVSRAVPCLLLATAALEAAADLPAVTTASYYCMSISLLLLLLLLCNLQAALHELQGPGDTSAAHHQHWQAAVVCQGAGCAHFLAARELCLGATAGLPEDNCGSKCHSATLECAGHCCAGTNGSWRP